MAKRHLSEPEALSVIDGDGKPLQSEVLNRPGNCLKASEEAVRLF